MDVSPRRPLYETQDHMTAESRLANLLKSQWKCELRKLSRKAQIDYAVYRKGERVAFAELKCRTNKKGAYSTYMLSLDKVMAAGRLGAVTNVPVFLIVSWTDAVGCMKITTPDRVDIGGRSDRNDPEDTELVGYYDIERHFVLVPSQ